MTGGARTLVYALAALCAGGGLWLQATSGGGVGLLVLAAAIAGSVALEGRYRHGRAARDVSAAQWQRTAEREIDSETGQPVEVWFDPLTGARRYVPLGEDPRLEG